MLSESFLKRLDELQLRLRHPAKGGSGGLRRSRTLGGSVEFSDYREYAPGDDVRRVDWNAYARFDRLFLKLFMEEQEQRVSLILDASNSMSFGEPSKWEAAKALAEALCYLALGVGDRVTLYLLKEGSAMQSRAFSSRHQYPQAVDFMDRAAPGGEAALAAALPALRLPAGTGMSVLISDLLCPEGYERAVQSLLFRKQETSVLQLLCPDELEPKLEETVELTDSETGERLVVSASYDLNRRYQEAARTFVNEAHAFCEKRGVTHALMSPTAPVEEQMLRALGDAGLIG